MLLLNNLILLFMRTRIHFVLTAIFFVFSQAFLFSQQITVSDLSRADRVVTVQDLKQKVKTLHPAAKTAVSRGEKPGQFTGVSYRYAGNVKLLSESQKSQINLRQDGIMDIAGKRFTPHPDTIYVDPASNLVFQANPVDEKQMLLLRPAFSSVFEEVEIPQQEVKVNLANTVSLAENVIASATGLNNAYAINLQFDSVTFILDEAKEGKLLATLVGQIIMTNPRVEGKYSKNGGYRLVFKTEEQTDIRIYTTMTAKKEIKTLIWGTEIPAGDIGKCELGVFLLINMEGKVTLTAEIHQGINLELGAKGGTCYYIPTSIENISSLNQWCDVDYDIKSEIKAFAGIQCAANLKIKDYNALYVYVNGGMEGTVATNGLSLSADIGFRIKAGGKVVSKSFTATDQYFSLWKYQKPDMKGYEMIIHEACAYGDYVAGEIYTLADSKTVPGAKEKIPYKGGLMVIVTHPDRTTNQYQTQTGDNGIFIAKNIPLKKGDLVRVKHPEVAEPCQPAEVTIPFREINLFSADYFTGTAEGFVAGSKSEWAKIAGASGQAVPGNVIKKSVAGKSSAIKGVISASEKISRINEFRNNLVVYRGPVEFISRPSSTNAQIVLKNPVTSIGSSQPVKKNTGMVNNPLGLFRIANLDFSPGQQVKARIVVEGFEIESDWIETDGIMVSGIEHEQLRMSAGPGKENITANNSFVVVSALSGEKRPEGMLKLLRGEDAVHGSVVNSTAVPEFPEVKKGVLWFSKTVELKPVAGNPSASIAETGKWDLIVQYSSPGDAINPSKNRKHPFELVSYKFKNQELGYSVFQNECLSCTSPENVVRKIGTQAKSDLPDFQKQTSPVPVQEPGRMQNKPGRVIR